MEDHVKKVALLLLLSILFEGCSPSDPLGGVEFGKTSVEEFKKEMTSKGILESVVINDEDYDTIQFFTINKEKGIKVPLWVHADDYDFDTLHSFKLNFGSDTVLFFGENSYRPGKGSFNKEKLELVLNSYKEWYGEPDYSFQSSREGNLIYEMLNSFKEREREEENRKGQIPTMNLSEAVNLRYCCDQHLIWDLKDYRVMLAYSTNFSRDSLWNGFIKYESLNYENIISQKKELIRKNATLNDYISMRLYLDPFTEAEFPYSDQLNLVVHDVGHNLPEEHRSIRKFKFDVTYEDEYGDEILNSEGLQFTNDLNLESPRNGVSTSLSSNFLFNAYFNRNSSNAQGFEKLRLMRESNNTKPYRSGIIIKYRITHIIFEDGEILKSDPQTGFVESK